MEHAVIFTRIFFEVRQGLVLWKRPFDGVAPPEEDAERHRQYPREAGGELGIPEKMSPQERRGDYDRDRCRAVNEDAGDGCRRCAQVARPTPAA